MLALKKSIVVRYLCVCTASSALVGCGGDGSGSATEDSGETSAGSTADESDTDAETSEGETSAGPTSEGSDSEASTDPETTDPTEDPTTEDPTTEDPTTEDPTTEDPTTEDPTTEDPSDSDSDSDSDSGTDTGGDDGVAGCYQDKFDEMVPLADYDQFGPIVGSHCVGTNHQDIEDVERVVFLGDSVTVGTPPTAANNFYRSRLADSLVAKFGLMPPTNLWKQVNPLEGKSVLQDSGDFSSCAEWGARTDDFVAQLGDCFNGPELDRTLVIITMGGNDLARWAKDATNENKPIDEIMVDVEAAYQLMADAIEFLTDPMNFPNGSYVIFANVYEYTDRTGDLGSCTAAQFQDLTGSWPEGMPVINSFNEMLMELAVESGTDMVFMSEEFCGHGFYHNDAINVCYADGNDNWFDLTCIHPTPDGHDNLAGMFSMVVEE